MKKNLISFLFVLLLLAGCSPKATPTEVQSPSEVKASNLKGTITVSGAFALYPMMVRWAEEFKKVNPEVEFDISAGGAGKGMSDALSGAVDIGMVSRAISPEEETKGAFWIPVTKDAVFVLVSSQNPVWQDLHTKGITKEALIGIYITGKITTWGQVIGRPEVSDPIHAFTRSDAAGAPETFAKYLGDKKQEDLLGVGVFGDPGLLDAVVKDPLGIGYNNLNYAYDPASGVPAAGAQVVPLDVNDNGKADSDEIYDTKRQAIDAVLTGKYPSPPARDLNLVTKGKPSGLLNAFITWVLTDGQKFEDEVGYIPIAKEQLDAGLQKLK